MVVILRSCSQSGGGILRTIFSDHIDGRLHHDVCTEPACVGPACVWGRRVYGAGICMEPEYLWVCRLGQSCPPNGNCSLTNLLRPICFDMTGQDTSRR